MASKTEYLEREVKLKAALDFTLPDFGKVVGGGTIRLPEQALHTSYFDTADFRLWDRGLTLRHRRGDQGQAGTWTLKLPEKADGSTLDRTELSWIGGQERIPPAATRVLQGVVRRAVLNEVVALESTRQRIILRTAGGNPLGEIDDDVVTVQSGARKGLTFRQIEFEIGGEQPGTSPDPDAVNAVLQELHRAGARSDGEQKFAKSLGLDTSDKRSAEVPRARSNLTLGDLVQLSLVNGLGRLLDHDYRLRINPTDPPVRAVHQARVATRRLRADLKTFAPVLDPVWRRHTRTELKWLGQVLGRIRDADVLADRFAIELPIPLEAKGADELRSRLAAQRRTDSAEMGDVLEGERYLSLLERLHAAAHSPPLSRNHHTSSHAEVEREPQADDPAIQSVSPLVRDQWKALQRKVRKVGHHPSNEQLHRIRIRSKHLRYAAEAATPAMGKSARRTAKKAEHLQNILGKHHDAVAAESWLRHTALISTSLASFVAGQFVADEQRKQKEYTQQWRSAWRELQGERATTWLR
jgi:CHAD domain-containing protein